MGAQLYDLKNVTITVGGLPMGAYGNNEAMMLEWGDDVVTEDISADGQPVISRTNDRRLRIGLTFLQTSQSIALLEPMMEAQHGNKAGFGPPVIAPIPFRMDNFTTGDFIVSDQTIFLNRITPGAAKSVGEVQFRLLLPAPFYAFGGLNINTIVAP